MPAITAVRVHAINNRNWFWTTIVSALGIGTVLGNFVSPLILDPSGACPQFLLSEAWTPTAIVGTNSPVTVGCYGGLEIIVPDASTDMWSMSVICAPWIYTQS